MCKRNLLEFIGSKGMLKWYLLVSYVFLLININVVKGVINKIVFILTPFTYGFLIAYLLNPLRTLLSKKLLGSKNKYIVKYNNELGLLFSYLLVTVLLFSFVLLVVPELYVSIRGLLKTAPEAIDGIIKSVVTWLNENISVFTNEIYNQEEIILYISKYSKQFIDNITTHIPLLFEMTKSISTRFLNLFLGYIISIYMLLNKDRYRGQFKKIIVALFSDEKSNKILLFLIEVHSTFSKFIIAKIIDSIIIGLICYIGCLFLGITNGLLIAVVVGVTNIIPYFGPFIGAIPTAVIVLFQNPLKMLIYVLFIFALQQFDGNYLGPKLMGRKLGLNSLLIIFAVIVMTGVFGVSGMLLGVPVFAILYMSGKEKLESVLIEKGKSPKTEDYM